MQRIIDAENSDLFDVLAHMAFALPTVTRLPDQIAQVKPSKWCMYILKTNKVHLLILY